MTRNWVRPGRPRLLAGLLLVGVFSAGALSGAAANHLVNAGESEPFGQRVVRFGPRSGGPSDGREQLRRSPAAMLERRLELTPEQAAEVEQVFEERRRRTEAILREVGPRLQTQRDSTDLEIRAVLIGNQIEAFDSMIEQRGGELRLRVAPPGRGRGPMGRFGP
ncbi:MAG: hypothetical protein GEU90_15675 [Gemmatimonas sp.]|nr:hypothetical protein [Gemmatimonas sp.]